MIKLEKIKPDIRDFGDMRDVVYDKKWTETAPDDLGLYYMYRDLAKNKKDKAKIIENDFTDIKKKEYVHSKFLDDGFTLAYNQEGGWGPCYSCFFQVYKR